MILRDYRRLADMPFLPPGENPPMLQSLIQVPQRPGNRLTTGDQVNRLPHLPQLPSSMAALGSCLHGPQKLYSHLVIISKENALERQRDSLPVRPVE